MDSHEPQCTGRKVCSKCGVEKTVLAFCVSRKESDGLADQCRECLNEDQRKRRPTRVKKRIKDGLEKLGLPEN